MTKESNITPEVKLFGLDIRRRREAMGMTVEKFASMADLSPDVLSAIESGEYEPVLSEVLAITEGFCINPAVLFSARDARGAQGAHDSLDSLDSHDAPEGHSALAEQVGRQFEQLAPKVQKAVLTLLKKMMKLKTK
jgi:transcriptional regulator with XRE-family HTH domain